MCEPLKAVGVGTAQERPWGPPERGNDLHKLKLIEVPVLLLGGSQTRVPAFFRLPEMSNCGCLPGRAGDAPLLASCRWPRRVTKRKWSSSGCPHHCPS